ncbi:MAG TPA: hypothetical protein VF659_09260 [Pyrinomonadaceae bacterium]|jgi:hypothetical protein
MTKKNGELVERGLHAVEAQTATELAATQGQELLIQAAQVLGAVKVTRSLATVISSQSFRALMQFRDEKMYEAFNFTRFDDFLNDSPHSPMTKSQFYERLNTIDREGDGAFDALNALNVPFSARKALPAGAVQLEGDTLVVGEERVPLNDRRRVIQAIKTLAEANEQQALKIEKGTEQNKKLKKKLDDQKQAGNGAALSDYDQALLNLLGAYSNLVSLAFELKDPERLEKREYTFARLADQRLQLEEALGVHAPSNGNGAYDLGEGELDELADQM